MGSVIFIAGISMIILMVWFFLIALRFGKHWQEGLRVELAFSQEQAAEGESLYLYETITNDKKQILPAISVKFKTSRYLKFAGDVGGTVSDYYYRNDVLSVRGYEKVRRSCRFLCMRRGEYEITEAELVAQDPILYHQYVENKHLRLNTKELILLIILLPIIIMLLQSHIFSGRMPVPSLPYKLVG